MTPAALRDGEVRYYASPVLVKNTQYYATITDQRLLIEGPKTHEFSVTAIQGAYPELLEGRNHGVKIIISTPKGQRDMIFAFPVEDMFKQGEQTSWIEAVQRATGDKPFATGTFEGVETETPLGGTHPRGIRFNEAADGGAYGVPAAGIRKDDAASSLTSPAAVPLTEEKPASDTPVQQVDLIPGEHIAVSTAGVRVKRSFYTAYLTNLRLILQNNLGKIGREFAIAEIKDAAEMESDAGEPELAISVGTQTGLKQMLLVYPTEASRSAWMIELRNKLPRRTSPAPQEPVVSKSRIGTFVPATNERTIITTPGVHIKNRLVVLHLTSTRFVVDSANGLMGEFAVSALISAFRMASELGEPGLSLKIGSPSGEREMHLIFPSMNDREAWIDALRQFIPEDARNYGRAYGAAAAGAGYGAAAGGYGSAGYAGAGYSGTYGASGPAGNQYTVTQVRPQNPRNPQVIECPNCGAQNPASESFCALCGSALHGGYRAPAGGASAGYGSTGGYPSGPIGGNRRGGFGRRDPLGPAGPAPGALRQRPAPRPPRQRAPRPEYTGSIIGFITRPQEAFACYSRESPRAAFPLFLIFGAIWAVLTAVCLTYLLPAVANIDPQDFPIFAALQEDLLLLVIFIIFLWILWLITLLVHSLIAGLLARLFSPSASIPEIVAITMRSSIVFAVVGWIPVFGMFAASIWAAVVSMFGLRTTQDLSPAGAAVAAFAGAVAVYVVFFIIGGGFA